VGLRSMRGARSLEQPPCRAQNRSDARVSNGAMLRRSQHLAAPLWTPSQRARVDECWSAKAVSVALAGLLNRAGGATVHSADICRLRVEAFDPKNLRTHRDSFENTEDGQGEEQQ
jgi:hypothetical protein